MLIIYSKLYFNKKHTLSQWVIHNITHKSSLINTTLVSNTQPQKLTQITLVTNTLTYMNKTHNLILINKIISIDNIPNLNK